MCGCHLEKKKDGRLAASGSENGDQSTLPPLAVHSLSVAVSLQPMPLQEFCPLHELRAVLQALVPLQELPPPHFTLAVADATDPRLPTANRIAAEARRKRCLVIWNSLGKPASQPPNHE